MLYALCAYRLSIPFRTPWAFPAQGVAYWGVDVEGILLPCNVLAADSRVCTELDSPPVACFGALRGLAISVGHAFKCVQY